MKRPPKKNDTLEVRLPEETKQAFMARAHAEGRSASEIVRDFIETYLARALTSKELPMHFRPTLAYAAAAAIGVIGIITLNATPSRAAPDVKAIFASLDANGDGKVTKDEMMARPVTGNGKTTGNPNGKQSGAVSLGAGFDDLDMNRDGSIVFAEFEAFSLAAIKKAFLEMDANSDGKIVLAEMTPRPASAKPIGVSITGAPEGFIAKFDKNKDGAVTETEFSDFPQ